MCLAHRRYYIEWKSSLLATAGYLPQRTFQVIWLEMPASKRSLVPAPFTTTAKLAFGGSSGALFSDFLAKEALCCQERKLCWWASTYMVACFLILSPCLWYSHSRRKWLPACFSLSLPCFPCLPVLGKEYTLVFEKGKRSPDTWVLSIGLGVARIWFGPHGRARCYPTDHTCSGKKAQARPLWEWDRWRQNKTTP